MNLFVFFKFRFLQCIYSIFCYDMFQFGINPNFIWPDPKRILFYCFVADLSVTLLSLSLKYFCMSDNL